MKITKSSSLVLLTVLSVAAYAAPQIPAPAVVVEETTTAPDIYKRRYVGNIVPINNVYSTAKVFSYPLAVALLQQVGYKTS